MTWDSGSAKMYYDGGGEVTKTYTPGFSLPTNFAVGGRTTGANCLNGFIDDFFILDYAVTAEEAAIIANNKMPFEGVWTNVSEDVRTVSPIKAFRGTRGNGPKNRVGDTGRMSLILDNSEANSAGLLGYYSPDHANLRSGFGKGTLVRWILTYGGTDYYKFRGKMIQTC